MNDNNDQLIEVDGLWNRKREALPPQCECHGEEALEGGNWASARLDWQPEQRGLRGHAAPLPFTAQAGGQTESSPRPRQPQVVFVACHHGSCSTELPPSLLSETNTIRVSGPCALVCESIRTWTSSQLCTRKYLPVQKLIA